MSYIEKEEEIIQFWKENRIFEKSVKYRSIKKPYVFYDGPPFATGLPHYGHILSFVTKDVFPRYWTMKNYRCERKWGWDCHGLPIESICERELKINQKNEICEMGLSKFNEFCRSKVLWYTNEWKTMVERMGKWIEFDSAYKTMDNSYMETVWFIFKKIYDEGYVYKGKKVLLYCPRCETPLSNSEISMDNSYKEITEKSIIAKFKLKDKSNTFLLAWSTTPWTLIGNVALAINSKLSYVKIKVDKEFLILAKSRLDIINENYKIVDEFKGAELVNKLYEPLYQVSAETEKLGHFIIDGGENVLSEEGTGIVHMALYGEFDYEMINKYDMPIIQHIDEQGKLADGPKNWRGLWFKDVNNEVLKDLDSRNLSYLTEDYKHSYPFCYRCDTPLIYNALDAWFINIQKVKSTLLKTNKQIKWYPKEISKRYQYILESAPDWCISRNRFWATALPIWECVQCNAIKVVGSVKELQDLAIESVPDNLDLHRHVVDDLHLECFECGSIMNRIPEVFDCWFESGSMPYAAKHYPFENVDWFKHNFPSDFVSEYIGQVRAWFYYMHVISILMFGEIPFKNIVVNGNILAEDGTKMSKSKKNFPDPSLIVGLYGADALRIYLLASQLMRAKDLNFKEDNVKQIYRRFNLLLSNVLKFYSLFEINNLSINNFNSENILDKWIINLVNNLTRDVTQRLDDYDTAEASKLIINFVEDLSTWYVKNSRYRFKSDILKEQLEAMNTLTYVLHNLSKILAPFTPFMAEMIYQKLRERKLVKCESVHLDFWPVFDQSLSIPNLGDKMNLTKEIVQKSLELREKANIPLRQALKKITLKGVSLEGEFGEIVAKALNVKEVVIKNESVLKFTIDLDTEITKELKLEGIARTLIRNINNYRKKMKLSTINRINLYLNTENDEILEAISKYQNEIKKMVQADAIFKKIDNKNNIKTFKINQIEISTYLEKT